METTPSPKSATHSSSTTVQLDNSTSSKTSTVSDKPTVSIPPSQLTHFALTRTWNALSTPEERYSLLSVCVLPLLIFRDLFRPDTTILTDFNDIV